MIDVAIIGGGPAGFSAALNVKARGRECLLISNDISSNPLARSPKIDNYVGMFGMSGEELLQKMRQDVLDAGVEIRRGHVLSVGAYKDRFMIAIGSDVVEARRVILATGVRVPKKLDGEDHFLGRGVSYCATCDGMLYRQKTAMVIGDADDLAEEASLLRQIGVDITVVAVKRPPHLANDIPFVAAKPTAVADGDPLVLETDGGAFPCHAVFILRNEQTMGTLVPGLAMDGRHVAVDKNGATNIPGLYAAGDCTGKPLQIATAVSEGLAAAWAATDSLNEA